MTPETYMDLKAEIIGRGFAGEVDWAETLQPVTDAETFWGEFAWVVLNSGMKNQVAAGIWRRVRPYMERGEAIPREAFGHDGKRAAMDYVRANAERLLAEYHASEDKLAWLGALPWIGPITKYHLAKNYGHDCAKPDRHLARIAAAHGETVEGLCQRLAAVTGDRVATVDLVIWRAANLGIVAAPTTPEES